MLLENYSFVSLKIFIFKCDNWDLMLLSHSSVGKTRVRKACMSCPHLGFLTQIRLWKKKLNYMSVFIKVEIADLSCLIINLLDDLFNDAVMNFCCFRKVGLRQRLSRPSIAICHHMLCIVDIYSVSIQRACHFQCSNIITPIIELHYKKRISPVYRVAKLSLLQ